MSMLGTGKIPAKRTKKNERKEKIKTNTKNPPANRTLNGHREKSGARGKKKIYPGPENEKTGTERTREEEGRGEN
jgi:hypothetical protein